MNASIFSKPVNDSVAGHRCFCPSARERHSCAAGSDALSLELESVYNLRMPSRRRGPGPDPVSRSRELGNQCRNEQQKAMFLSEVAHIRGELKSAELCRKSDELIRESRKVRRRSQELRAKRPA